MVQIRNEHMALFCEDSGRNLAIVDLKRGTRWAIDEQTLVYGSGKGKGEPRYKLQPLVPVEAEIKQQDVMVIRYKAGEEVVEMQLQVQQQYLEICMPSDRIKRVGAVSLPGSFKPCGEAMQLVLPIMQGMLWNGRGDAFEWNLHEGRHGGFSMPIVGYISNSGGLLVTSETRDDLELWMGKDASGQFWANYLQTASLGSMRYERVARVYLTEPDIVSIAKTYRKKVKEQGRFKNWEEKIAERPALERLFGSLMCFIGYCQDELDYVKECRKLKDYGFDRALIYPARFNTYNTEIQMGGLPPVNLDRQTVEGIKQLGYDIAPWSWLNEALDDGTDYVKQIFRRNQEGDLVPHWAIDEQRWYWACTTFMEQYQNTANAGAFADMSWDHFDVITCAANGECYALDHPAHLGRPLSRTEDREWIKKLLIAGQAGNRAVSSESFNDAFSVEYDLGSVKAFPMFNHWPFWPIPLTMLVYHDSMIHSWWEMHSYNNHYFNRLSGTKFYEYGGGRPRIQAAQDALMGCPPDVFPFGAQYGWTGRGHETFAFKFRLEDPIVQYALSEALPVAQLHRRIGKLEMVHFKILSEDGYVQETAFADGTRIVANFANEIRKDIPGTDPLQAESWRATV